MKASIALLGLVLVSIMLVLHETKADFSGQLWNKYRVSLIQMLEPRFAAVSQNSNVHHTVFSVLTDPDEARWTTSKEHLQDYFASHPIKWSSKFAYVGRTADTTVYEYYQKGVLACKNQNAFLAFKQAKVDFFNGRKSYPWVEVGETLQGFVNRANSGQSPRIHFIVQESSGSMTIDSPWGRSTTTLNNAGPFVAALNPAKVQSDTEIDEIVSEDDEEQLVEELAASATGWLFRRRRRAPPPPPPQQVIHIKSQTFKMDFQAQGLTGIHVTPGPWFDLNFIRQSKACLSPFIATGKPLALIPKVAWVALKPHITLTLSHTEWVKVQSIWNSPNTLGMTIGGSLFKHKNYKKYLLSDKAAWNALSEEQRAFYANEELADEHEDEVVFNVQTVERTLEDAQDDVLFNVETRVKTLSSIDDSVVFKTNTIERIVHDDDEFVPDVDEILSEDDEAMLADALSETASTWLFRRRRRAPPPPPPPPRKVYEQVYTVQFKSNSPFPEIIAVTSQKVENL